MRQLCFYKKIVCIKHRCYDEAILCQRVLTKMFKKIGSSISVVLLFVLLSLSAYSSPSIDDASLAKRCHMLSVDLVLLAAAQVDLRCKYYIDIAREYAAFAESLIISKNYHSAKFYLSDSIKVLIRAEKIACLGADKISFSKNEFEQINSEI